MKAVLFTLYALLASAVAHSASSNHPKRAIVTNPESVTQGSFDYVIVGGGTAGLTLARRLSDGDSKLKIAVIEAGDSGEAVQDSIAIPAMAYLDGIANSGSPYDWQFSTTNQTGLNGRQIYWPRGKILGGSSAVNGLWMTRHSQVEQEVWASFLDSEGAKLWSWDLVNEGYKKSETYGPPLDANAQASGMKFDTSLHGHDGPIHYSYPGYFYDSTHSWIETFGNLGISQVDPATGQTWGAYISTSCINPSNWHRSYAKNGYLDPVADRENLVVITGYTATKIVFDGTTATGVEIATAAGQTPVTVSASREIILSGGVVGSPHLLLVSGVGPRSDLEALNIPVVVDLPGVGMNLVDHLVGTMRFNAANQSLVTADLLNINATFAAEQLALWRNGDSNSLYNSPNVGTAYVDLPTLMNDTAGARALIQEAISNSTNANRAYRSHSQDSTVLQGNKKVYDAELEKVYASQVGQVEILLSNTGSYGGYGDSMTVGVQAAIQHPLSRGSIKLATSSIFDIPVIDPNYLSNTFDITVLRECFKYARRVASTEPLASLLGEELAPGTRVQTDEQWDTWIRSVVSTEYHPQSTCSMLPLEDGGVVDANLRVHGTSHLRIVDASIIPNGFSAHLMAPVYGISERAYEIIVNSDANSNTSTGKTTGTGTPTKSGASNTPVSTGVNGNGAGSRNLISLALIASAVGTIFVV